MEGLRAWVHVGISLRARKRNGRGSTGCAEIVRGSTPEACSAFACTSIENSSCESEFVGCNHAIDETLLVREKLRCFGCKIDHISSIFCGNKIFSLVACVTSILFYRNYKS